MSWGKRSDYPKLAPVSLEAGPPLTWGILVRGMCRVYGIHHECGCPLDERPVVHGSPELVHQGPQPEAHKSIHDYRDQLAAKRRRKKRRHECSPCYGNDGEGCGC